MKKLLGVLVALSAFGAQPALSNPIFGAPSDDLLGCDSSFSGSCQVTFDENGAISASFHSFLWGDLTTTVAHVAATSNPAYVDSRGAPLEVTSYTLQVADPSGSGDNGFAPFFNGAVGLCEFGVLADGSACAGLSGDDKSDVVVFNYSSLDQKLHIDFLSDGESAVRFATDFNVLEVGPEGANGAIYHPLGNTGGGEDVVYNIISDSPSVPEPTTWAMMLVGVGAIGALTRRRKTALAAS